MVALGALEDGDPRQPRLLAIEAELGKQLAGVITSLPTACHGIRCIRVWSPQAQRKFHFSLFFIGHRRRPLASATSWGKRQHSPTNPCNFAIIRPHARRYTPSVHIQSKSCSDFISRENTMQKFDVQNLSGPDPAVGTIGPRQGCTIIQPLDMEVGAGTSPTHDACAPWAWSPSPAPTYIQPSRRPTDGRYDEPEPPAALPTSSR